MGTERQVYLLIAADELRDGVPFLSVLSVEKKGASTQFEKLALDRSQLAHMPEPLKPLLRPFLENQFMEVVQEFKKQHHKQRSGISLDIFLKRAVFRHLHEITTALFNTARATRIYHQARVAGGGYKTAVCQLSAEVPGLSFEVIREENGALQVQPLFHIREQTYTASQLQRHKFLLLTGDEYFILKLADFQVLEWLSEKRPEQYAFSPNELARHILLPLEERYQVERNGHFPVRQIDTEPQSVVLLSEISGAFLMLTPRWNYDGFLVEGNFSDIHHTHVQGELYAIHRKKEAEQAFLSYLKALHPGFARQINGYFYLSFEEAKKKQWFLKTFHQWLEDNVEIHGMDMLHHFRYSAHSIETRLEVERQAGAMLYLYMKVTFGKEEAPLHELKKLLISGQQYILLKDNSMGVLTDEWIASYGMIIKHGQISKNTVTIPQWIMLAMNREQTPDSLQPIITREWWNKWTDWQDESKQTVQVPGSLQATLRPYQLKGFEWMAILSEIGAGALLADDMGLGKTLQTIAFLLYRLEMQPEARFLIACPASLMYNWQQEISRFSIGLKSQIYHQSRRNLQHFFDSKAQVLICSYGTLRADIDALQVFQWDVAVLDESHSIKNQQTQVSKSVAQLSAVCRIALSGTPVMNNTEDLYPQLNFLLPGYIGSNEFFRKEYALPIDRNRDEKKIQMLNRLTNPFILRRTKEQVATDLPAKTEAVLWCKMNDQQKECYETIKASIRNSIFLGIRQDGLNKNKLSILQGIQKLRQACAAPALIKDLEYPCSESVKLEVLMEEIRRLGTHKALIFSQFKGMLHLIAAQCRKEGILYYHIDGDTPVTERQALVNSFQEEGNFCKVFLISLMTGNAGLNLTAADYVFLVDPWWNTAVQQQAIDRTHRIGQNKNVFAYKMICKDTIEERILQLQQRKQSLSEELINEEDGFVKQLTEDDVAFLFE